MYLDSLVARGLISPDALQNLIQQTGGPTGGPFPLQQQPLGGMGAGGGFRPTQGAQATRRESVLNGLQAGKSYGEIAEDLGISRNAVAGTIRDLQLEGYGQNWKPPRLTDAQARARQNPQGKIDPTSDEQRLLRLKQIRRPLTESEQDDLSALNDRLKPASAEPDYNYDPGSDLANVFRQRSPLR